MKKNTCFRLFQEALCHRCCSAGKGIALLDDPFHRDDLPHPFSGASGGDPEPYPPPLFPEDLPYAQLQLSQEGPLIAHEFL